ncbi:site-specific integrase [Lacticaseibacillus zeae]|uniref:site-specific integrase n=1 Tax=Lacticaseibacillus zeae TaxID=57037 RepID=UPI0024C36591|nr:site-specific integrase [Lacticaseibacillus zeae]
MLKINGEIREAVQVAVEENLIRKDFTHRVVLSGGKTSKSSDLKYLNADEIERLIAEASKNPTVGSVSKYMILTAVYTGMRLAEIGGLTWDDVNFNFMSIRINKTYDYQNVGHFKETKNTQSHRVIKMPKGLATLLKRLKNQQELVFDRLYIHNPLNLVFLNSQNSVPGSAAVNKTLRVMLDRINVRSEIKNLNFHSLRHTHASYLLYKGVSIYYISKRLGHSNISTTLNVYSHIINELDKQQNEKALGALDDLTASTKSNTNKRLM